MKSILLLGYGALGIGVEAIMLANVQTRVKGSFVFSFWAVLQSALLLAIS